MLPSSAKLSLLPLLLVAGLAHGHGRDPHARVAAEKGWRTDLRSAREEARKTGKPLMIVLRCFD